MGAIIAKLLMPEWLKTSVLQLWVAFKDALSKQLRNEFLVGGLTISVAGFVSRALWLFMSWVKRTIMDSLVTTVAIPAGTSSYSALVAWLAARPEAKNASHLTIQTRSETDVEGASAAEGSVTSSVVEDGEMGETLTRKVIDYIPSDNSEIRVWVGEQVLWIRAWGSSSGGGEAAASGWTDWMHDAVGKRPAAGGPRKRGGRTPAVSQSVSREAPGFTVSLLGRDLTAVTTLIADGMKLQKAAARQVTAIYTVAARRPDSVRWVMVGKRPARSIDSVILENDTHLRLLDDAQTFMRSERWYFDHGLPYRRGYLLFGKPGAGKSSLVSALAGELRAAIYMCSLSAPGITDESLMHLINKVGSQSIILLEDVDAAFASGEGVSSRALAGRGATAADIAASTATAVANAISGDDDAAGGGSLTFSGILNALDGVVAQQGGIIIMTTNHPEKLDSALVRPGRIDVTVEFDNATQEQARRLFLHFYSDLDTHSDDTPTNPKLGKTPSTQQASASGSAATYSLKTTDADSPDIVSPEQLERLADSFSSAIEPRAHSMAQLQGYLMQFRQHPRSAASNVHQLRLPYNRSTEGGAAQSVDAEDSAWRKDGVASDPSGPPQLARHHSAPEAGKAPPGYAFTGVITMSATDGGPSSGGALAARPIASDVVDDFTPSGSGLPRGGDDLDAESEETSAADHGRRKQDRSPSGVKRGFGANKGRGGRSGHRGRGRSGRGRSGRGAASPAGEEAGV